jgi:hypothetical protein
MTEEQQAKVRAYLTGKLGNCSGCGKRGYTIAGLITCPNFTFEAGVELGGSIIPMVAMACSNCSKMTFYAAIPMGLMPEPKL